MVDPEVAQAIEAIDESRLAANVFDGRWRLVHTTHGLFPVAGNGGEGEHVLSAAFHTRLEALGTTFPDELLAYSARVVPYVLDTMDGDRAALRAIADPRLHAAIDAAERAPPPSLWTAVMTVRPGGLRPFPMRAVVSRLDRADGTFAGTAELWIPNLSAALLNLISPADPTHLERLARVVRAQRRPSAILFADLEASTPLARRLSTGSYFTLIRRVMREVDQLVVAHGGLVGRHVGDGLTAYYPAELAGSDAAAARAAVATAHKLPQAVLGAAATVPGTGDVLVNAAVHWGATVRLGAMLTVARFEVTALGEEVNEAARMEACASGGRLLASKALVERLDDADVAALGIETSGSYLPLAEVPGAPEKARRDAPTLAVREL